MSEPPEDLETPVDAEATMVDAEGQWRNVPRPTTEELLTPSAQVVDTPSIPRAVKIIGIIIILVLLLLSVWLGLSLGKSASNTPEPTPTVEEPLWELEPPIQVGQLVRGDVKTTPKASEGDRDIVTTPYTDGVDKVILLLSRPEEDLGGYLEDAGVPISEPVEDSDGVKCGYSEDNIPVCARVVDDTAVGVAGLTEQDFDTLTSLVDSFYEEMQ